MNRLSRAVALALVVLGLSVVVAQVYRLGERAGRAVGVADGIAQGCAWADQYYSSKDNDEVGAVCMESLQN